MTLTANKNYLQPTGFKIVISRENYPNLEFFAQSINHPDVTLTGPNIPYPRIENVNFPGDALGYSELGISFILDEEIESYTELYNWMVGIVNNDFVPQQGRTQRVNPQVPTQADISISILSSHNNENKRILYKGCNPTSLSGLQLTSIASSVEYLTFDGSFSFTSFDIRG
tara:strand:- start:4875 stop:5384 length:510 start_codon:yes stop_codon:yes gene_type:complete